MESEAARRRRLFSLVFAAETGILIALRWNQYFLFDEYASLDQGSVLAVNHLIGRGLRPEVDFGYSYGLLPLLAGRAIFRPAGAHPLPYAIAIASIELALAAGIWRIVRAMPSSGAAMALVALAMPLMVTRYDNLAYAMEAAFLAHAFAEHLRGRIDRALALAIGAALCKPAMGYIYGAMILAAMAAGRAGPGRHRFKFAPLALSLAAIPILAGVFGTRSLVRTLLPTRGIASYRAMHTFGIRAATPDFMRQPGLNWHYYVGTYAVFRIGCLAFLVAAAAGCAVRAWRRRGASLHEEAIIATAVLAIADGVLLSFHYPYIAPIGAVLCAGLPGWPRLAAIVLCFVAIPPFSRGLRSDLAFAREHERSCATGGLWARAELMREWEWAMKIAAGRRTAALGEMGAAGLVAPGIEPPEGAFFPPGNALEGDIEREYRQLESAEVVILFRRFYPYSSGTVLDTFPGLRAAVKDTDVVFRGERIEVRVRRPRKADGAQAEILSGSRQLAASETSRLRVREADSSSGHNSATSRSVAPLFMNNSSPARTSSSSPTTISSCGESTPSRSSIARYDAIDPNAAKR
jgi:hypothetical protein